MFVTHGANDLRVIARLIAHLYQIIIYSCQECFQHVSCNLKLGKLSNEEDSERNAQLERKYLTA